MRYDGSESIKNMDDVLLFGRTLEKLHQKIEVFVKYCEEKNLKLKPSKMVISEEVEFAGTVVKAETVQNEDVVSILPRDKSLPGPEKASHLKRNSGVVWDVEFTPKVVPIPTTKS